MSEARAAELRSEIAAHKAAIRRHRALLARAKGELVAIEAPRLGIKVVTAKGKEDPNPWPSQSSTSTRS